MPKAPHPDSEEALENAAIAVFQQLGWTTANCFHEIVHATNSTLGRNSKDEVVLVSKLLPALQRLNPNLPDEALQLAIEEITNSRNSLSLVNANQEIYQLLKSGVKVRFRDENNAENRETVKIIDWNNPSNNDFFLDSQFWITGETYTRRADLIGFVNGIPLVFIELKAHHQKLENAYYNNLKDYKASIPQLFWYNALIILSNGSKSKISSLTAEYSHFSEWKKINSEGEEGIISLDTMIRGTCDPNKLLDYIENFAIFNNSGGTTSKIIAKNHQFLGVNNAIEAVSQISHNQGKLGIFWHTQGSGKSYSMVFFAQKILRKLLGNWTFIIITDREDLDSQIYKNFAYSGAVTEPETDVRADSAEHLKQLLQEDHRYIFTLIQKFRVEKGTTYPKLSDRSNIIVMADEAHRSQYDTFALNMRNAMPNAAFIGFTGTPLISGEEKTREVFGDYVSIYNFKQSVEDGATVPLFYENRIPELQLTNKDLNGDMAQIIETATLDDEAEKKLERQCKREYQLIVRDDRLEKIAADLVTHFLGRGYQGKAMFIAIDRFTALKMYNKVKHYWQIYLDNLKTQVNQPNISEFEIKKLSKQIRYIEETDMAVVISPSQNEIEAFQKKGLDITPHRKRLVNESPTLEEKFKDANNPLRIVFVCAMWITGFDVPNCSTIYLDKPIRNHSLMQAIARANRVYEGKGNGLIVDYIGVFRDLQNALSIYGSSAGGGIDDGDTPVKAKSALVEQLRMAIGEALEFCKSKNIDLIQLDTTQDPFSRTKLWDEAVNALADEASQRNYFALVNNVNSLYKSVLPDTAANEFANTRFLLDRLADKIRQEIAETDISEVLEEVNELLDNSIMAGEFIIHGQNPIIDITKIDFKVDVEALKAKFNSGYQQTAIAKLQSNISQNLQQMVQVNRTRMNYLEKFQKMIDEYNSGSRNQEIFFRELIKFHEELTIEEKRKLAENLTDEELVIFDLLTKPELELTKQERQDVKNVAKELLETLKQNKLVLDWRKRQQTKAEVEITIKDILDQLPRRYTVEIYEQKCQEVYQHIYESYSGTEKSICS
ncbi:MAG: type I restriction endonuclease subunit R [Pseudanabaenaceae cyanobacterium]